MSKSLALTWGSDFLLIPHSCLGLWWSSVSTFLPRIMDRLLVYLILFLGVMQKYIQGLWLAVLIQEFLFASEANLEQEL